MLRQLSWLACMVLLFVLPCRAAELEFVGDCELPQMNYLDSDVFVQGHYAYVAGAYSGLQIIDFSNVSEPFIAGVFDTVGFPTAVVVRENRAYVAWRGDELNGLVILDVTYPPEPAFISSCWLLGTPHHDIVVGDDIAYIASCWRLYLVNIADVTNPFYVSHYPSPGLLESVFLYGHYIYSLVWYCGFIIVDVADPSAPELVGSYYQGGNYGRRLLPYRDYVYLASRSQQNGLGMGIVDVSNPQEPDLAKIYDINAEFINAVAVGDYLFVATAHPMVFDISHPVYPVLVASTLHPSFVRDIFVQGNLVFTLRSDFLTILSFDPTGIDDDSVEEPTEFSLDGNYPNPFNMSTTIQYSLVHPTEITLDIYDILGTRVQRLYDGIRPAGRHSYTWDASSFASGVYFYRLTAGEFSEARKMLMVK